jgi:hypothetical protein
MLVTPKQARDWLKKNTANRPLRPNVVEGFMNAYARGEWKVTHQGIAFSKEGVLLDGQHRLSFISELPDNVSIPLNVTTGQDAATFDSIDIGFKRTMSDMYGASAGSVACARLTAKIASSDRAGFSNQFVYPFLVWVTPEFEELITYCPTSVRVWSSAPVRTAAVIQMKRGYDADFIKAAYAALVQQHVSGKIASARSLDLFVRALRVFDSDNTRKVSKLLIRDQAPILEDVRNFILSEMKKSPLKGGQQVAKPSAKFNWKKAA